MRADATLFQASHGNQPRGLGHSGFQLGGKRTSSPPITAKPSNRLPKLPGPTGSGWSGAPMTLSKDYYQEVQEAVREWGDAFMVHNSRLGMRKALQAAIELNQLIEELNDLKANTPPEVWAAMA